MNKTHIYLYVVLLLTLLAGACAKKTQVPPPPPGLPAEEIADIKNFPQNLEVYARSAGPEKPLLSASRQQELDATFNDIWFGPWQMRRSSISKREIMAPLRKPWGYRSDSSRWNVDHINALRANARPEVFPNAGLAGITLRQTDLREIPTHEPRYAKPTPDPKKDPFDYLQYSLLPPGMPLFIAHTSQDGKWHYIECPIAGGWVDANDIGIATQEFISHWRTGKYAALIHDRVILPGTGKNGTDSMGGIGAVLPIVNDQGNSTLKTLLPIQEKNGTLAIAETELSKEQAVVKPLRLIPANVAKVGNQLLGQSYGWGGMLGLRDCSAMVRDLFTPFGIWLPRNSKAQARRGLVKRLDGLSVPEKEMAILRDGVPFLSLVGLPGHITLYIGAWKGKAALFHNAWGLRIIKDGNDDERFIIGKAIITSILPGMELPNLYRPKTFVDRINTLTQLGQ